MEVEHALDAVARALKSVSQSQLFATFQMPAATRIIASLNSGVLDGSLRDAGGVLGQVCMHLSEEHPLLRLFIQATCVKALSKDLWNENPDEESSAEEEEEQATLGMDTSGDNVARRSTNPLDGLQSEQIADLLMSELKEVEAVRTKMIKIANKLGAERVWELLLETNQQIANDTAHTVTTCGTRKRTGGGIFLRLAQAKLSEIAKQAELAAAPEFILRPYQQAAVDTITSQGGNWVVAAPTNTGKTAIFIEVSRLLLEKKPSGTVVVVVPTVSLVRQQSIAYEKAGFRPASAITSADPSAPAVDWFCGDKPLCPGDWKQELKRLNVIVIEAQSFANLLISGVASLTEIDLLVLDECHHTAKQHPYARVMHSYPSLLPSSRPQVLGFSASPANGKTEGNLQQELERLLKLMHAKLFVVSEDDALVQQVAPGPQQEERVVDVRLEDGYVQEWLRHLMHGYAILIGAALDEQLNQPDVPPSSREKAQELLATLPSDEQSVRSNPLQAYNELCAWMNAAMDIARTWKLPNLGHSVQVLEVLRRAEALCSDVGHECALQYTAQRLVVLATVPALDQVRVLSLASPNKRLRMSDLDHLSTLDLSLSALRQHVATGPSSAEIAQAQEAVRPLTTLHPCKDIVVTANHLCRMFVRELSGWDGRSDPLSSFQVASSVAALQVTRDATPACKKLADKAVAPLLPGGLAAPPACHHKIWELVQYLKRYKDQDRFHGIIFCRSRQVAHYLVELLRAASLPPVTSQGGGRSSGSGSGSSRPEALLSFIDDVALFVGHGARQDDKSRAIGSNGLIMGGAVPGSGEGLAARGMNVTQQQAVLEQFKTPGRKVLVATNAAEEGLDLPCCEFVVRFSPPSTGIQRVQGRGRARKLGAHYMCLVQPAVEGSLQHGGNDIELHTKSGLEEQVLRRVMAKVANKQVV